MNNEILTTKAINTLTVSGAATGSSLTIAQQLSVLYPFLYLQLPLWVFFIIITVAALLGALGALLTDVIEDEPNTLKKIALAFGTGITSAFLVLPSIVEAPAMGTLILTSLGMSFSGTIIIFIMAQVLKDRSLQTAIKNSISKSIIYGFSKIEKLLDYLIGNKKK